ncbi:hypothetical protein NW951_10810 [Staphylococcus aureus]|nr:hypothetical protein [Staphylococcus aureus]UVI86984.1 hypothetical protein NW951_10810 [Staphylococcus aureus]UVJ28198.1 hypothetical protein NW963_11140 [Staphylococcus aureus]
MRLCILKLLALCQIGLMRSISEVRQIDIA